MSGRPSSQKCFKVEFLIWVEYGSYQLSCQPKLNFIVDFIWGFDNKTFHRIRNLTKYLINRLVGQIIIRGTNFKVDKF